MNRLSLSRLLLLTRSDRCSVYSCVVLPAPTFKRDISRRCFTSSSEQQQVKLQSTASALTRALYRRCLRSVHLIKAGNDYDEQEFRRREAKQQEEMNDPSRHASLSFLPPVHRQDELRSRMEYYWQYSRECITQESDLDFWTTSKQKSIQIAALKRYLHHIRQGEQQRQWLLQDMKFDHDPCRGWLQEDVLQQLEQDAMEYILPSRNSSRTTTTANSMTMTRKDEDEANESNDFWDDDDDDEEEEDLHPPKWYKNPR